VELRAEARLPLTDPEAGVVAGASAPLVFPRLGDTAAVTVRGTGEATAARGRAIVATADMAGPAAGAADTEEDAARLAASESDPERTPGPVSA
jgi:hypothetical protein